jgi:hypothetical protein
MYSAIDWAFSSGIQVGRGFPVWLLPFLAFIFYPLLFVPIFIFLETPVHFFRMKNHHVGGLLGYGDEYKAWVYDPSGKAYISYEHLTPPIAAGKFTESFSVVLFYKFRPSSKYYKNAKLKSLSSQLTMLFVAILGLLMISISLYLLADAYITENGLQIELSHQFLAEKFYQVTGVTLVKAMLITLSAYVCLLAICMIYFKVLNIRLKIHYSSDQRALRSKLLNSVSPEKTITGRVVSRQNETISIFKLKGYKEDKQLRNGQGSNTLYYTIPVFTVEFRDIIPIPVYLSLTTRSSKSARKDEKMLNSLFSDEWEDVPNKMPELDFIVNPDYSISLRKDVNK